MVRTHKRTRKHIHGSYDLRIETRRRRFARRIIARSERREGAIDPLQESDGQKLDRATRCRRGGEGLRGPWAKTFERGSAHSLVGLSLSMVVTATGCGEEWDDWNSFSTRILSRGRGVRSSPRGEAVLTPETAPKAGVAMEVRPD